jgi:hypothetical protein
MSMPSARAACPGQPCVQPPAAASVQHTQPCTDAPSPRTSRTRRQKGAMLTVLGATLVTTIPVLLRLQLGSYGYALPQTPKEPSFQPPHAIEHFPFLLYPFEFPRPFEVFEGCPFSTEASSETPSNTFFDKGLRCSRCSRVRAVLAKPKHRAIGWPLGVIHVGLGPPKPS